MTKLDAPTNGSRGSGDEPAPAVELPRDATDDHGAAPPSAADYSTAFSPRQLAAGFAIIAGLIVLLARRRKKG